MARSDFYNTRKNRFEWKLVILILIIMLIGKGVNKVKEFFTGGNEEDKPTKAAVETVADTSKDRKDKSITEVQESKPETYRDSYVDASTTTTVTDDYSDDPDSDPTTAGYPPGITVYDNYVPLHPDTDDMPIQNESTEDEEDEIMDKSADTTSSGTLTDEDFMNAFLNYVEDDEKFNSIAQSYALAVRGAAESTRNTLGFYEDRIGLSLDDLISILSGAITTGDNVTTTMVDDYGDPACVRSIVYCYEGYETIRFIVSIVDGQEPVVTEMYNMPNLKMVLIKEVEKILGIEDDLYIEE